MAPSRTLATFSDGSARREVRERTSDAVRDADRVTALSISRYTLLETVAFA